jgi:E3 ubiquitin-protein ligase DOA10
MTLSGIELSAAVALSLKNAACNRSISKSHPIAQRRYKHKFIVMHLDGSGNIVKFAMNWAIMSGEVFHRGVTSAPLSIRAANRTDHSVANTFLMIIHSTICSDISYLLRKMHFFLQKLYMTFSLHVRQNGPEINPPVSRAQKAFGPGRRQRTYCCTWR